MGREATCHCELGNESGECKALLESTEIILRGTTGRGSIKRKILIAQITGITVSGDQLKFQFGKEKAALTLGVKLAQSWAKKLTTPPPTLATKLGIAAGSKILILGEPESPELAAALADAKTVTKSPDLIVLCAHFEPELNQLLLRATAQAAPIWVIYPKGAKSTLPETAVRNTLRSLGYIDVKVASVSGTLTALRFNRVRT
jgi:hypothetical protein